MPDIEQILDAIQTRISEAHAEIASLTSARSILAGDGAGTGAATNGDAPPAPPKSRRTRRTAAQSGTPAPKRGRGTAKAEAPSPRPAAPRRTRRDATAEAAAPPRARRRGRAAETPETTIEALLRESADGLSAVALSKRAGMSYARVLTRLRELAAAGIVTSSGTSRTSLWRVITDDEKIAARVAELEKAAAKR